MLRRACLALLLLLETPACSRCGNEPSAGGIVLDAEDPSDNGGAVQAAFSASPDWEASVQERADRAYFQMRTVRGHCLAGTPPGIQDRCAVERAEQPAACENLFRTAAAEAERTDLPRRLELLDRLGEFLLAQGRVTESVDAYRQAAALGVRVSPEAEHRARIRLGIAELRQGEFANCLENHNAETCILPLTPAAYHRDPGGSAAAVKTFGAVLAKDPGDRLVRWLLNLGYMTLGAYPHGVPEKWRIPPEAFRSRSAFPRFRNLAPELGFHDMGLVGSVAVDDFNGDGRLDILRSSAGYCDPLRLALNDGRGGFTDVTEAWGLDSVLGAVGLLQADYDNDGDLDVYVTRGIWERPGIHDEAFGVGVRNTLLRNEGGRFRDVTREAGLFAESSFNIASVWGDFDGNGRLDLFVCDAHVSSRLYENVGDRFSLKADSGFGVHPQESCMGVAAGDPDDDGDTDLFVSVHRGKSRLYLNDGDGVFSPLETTAFDSVRQGFPAFFFDADQDGRDDLFVGAWDGKSEDLGALMQGMPHGAEAAHLFLNRGSLQFEDAGQAWGLNTALLVMGANFGDLDNDGWPDLLLGTGGPPFEYLLPNRIYRNANGRGFDDVTFASGMGVLQKGHGIGLGDLDQDGDRDVVASFGGWVPGDTFADSIFENPGFPGRMVSLRLQGVEANRSAIGSRLRIRIREGGRERVLYRTVTPGGSFGSSTLAVEIGIGSAAQIDELEIRWARPGATQTLRNLKAGGVYRIVEGHPDAETLTLPALKLASRKANTAHH